MSGNNEIQLLLGCFGRIDDGFVSCRGCENNILDIGNHLDKYNEMMDYFDSCRLFDKPIFEYSSIRHFINNMQSRFDQVAVGRPLWLPNKYRLIEKFTVDHRLCGIYVKLGLNKQTQSVEIEEKPTFIRSITNIQKQTEAPKFGLKLRPISMLTAGKSNVNTR